VPAVRAVPARVASVPAPLVREVLVREMLVWEVARQGPARAGRARVRRTGGRRSTAGLVRPGPPGPRRQVG